jgi:hypothetical protein
MDEDKAGLIFNAIGMAVMDLMAAELPIDRKNLIGQLEQNRQQANNIAGKLANRDAVELVRNYSERSLH